MRYQKANPTLFDLKFFGSEFLKVKDDVFPLITAIPSSTPNKSPRTRGSKQQKSKIAVAKSMEISFSTYDAPFRKTNKKDLVLMEDNLDIQTLENQIAARMGKQMHNRNTKSLSKIEKLRDRIKSIKKANDKNHRDILDTYNKNSNDLVADIKINTRPVKKIKKFYPELQKQKLKNKLSKNKDQQFINQFYNNIGKENQESAQQYKKRLCQIQLTLKNSQIPKKVQQFLLSKNMRIPKFLRQLKS